MSKKEGRTPFLTPTTPEPSDNPQYHHHPQIDINIDNKNTTKNTPLLPPLDTIIQNINSLPLAGRIPTPATEIQYKTPTDINAAYIERTIPKSIPNTLPIPICTGTTALPIPIPIPAPNVLMKKSTKSKKAAGGPSSAKRKNKINMVKSQLEGTRATIEKLAQNIQALEAENQAMRDLLANLPNERQQQKSQHRNN